MGQGKGQKKNYKVLVVDDESKSLLLAKKMLAAENLEILISADPSEAIEMIADRGPIAVVFSDNRMATMRGTEFLEKVKSLSPMSARILTTAFYDKQLIEDIVNKAEAFRFLNKPIDFKLAIKYVQQGLEKYEQNIKEAKLSKNIEELNSVKEELTSELASVSEDVKSLSKTKTILIAAIVVLAVIAGSFNFVREVVRQAGLKTSSQKIDHWVVYNNKTALDSKTGLMWMTVDYRSIEGRNPKSWDLAMKWAKTINSKKFAGYTDWRVPTIEELKGTYDPSMPHLAYDSKKDFPVGYSKAFESGGGYGYWSSVQVGLKSAKYFFFIGGYGKTVLRDYSHPTMSVRLVREP